MSDPKIEAIQRMYAAFGRGDLDAILTDVADDVDWAVQPGGTTAPWYGSYRGKAEVSQFFEAIGKSVDVTEFSPLLFTANDSGVMATVRWSFHRAHDREGRDRDPAPLVALRGRQGGVLARPRRQRAHRVGPVRIAARHRLGPPARGSNGSRRAGATSAGSRRRG